MKITARRYPCPGCRKNLIWHNYPKHTRSYQVTANRCRKCARKDQQKQARVEKHKHLAEKRERTENHE